MKQYRLIDQRSIVRSSKLNSLSKGNIEIEIGRMTLEY